MLFFLLLSLSGHVCFFEEKFSFFAVFMQKKVKFPQNLTWKIIFLISFKKGYLFGI